MGLIERLLGGVIGAVLGAIVVGINWGVYQVTGWQPGRFARFILVGPLTILISSVIWSILLSLLLSIPRFHGFREFFADLYAFLFVFFSIGNVVGAVLFVVTEDVGLWPGITDPSNVGITIIISSLVIPGGKVIFGAVWGFIIGASFNILLRGIERGLG